MTRKIVLAGDVGGTSTRFSRVVVDGNQYRCEAVRQYSSASFADFGQALDTYAAETGTLPNEAAFGVAGPVEGGVARITNLPWTIDVARLRGRFASGRCVLLNDLEAMGWGLAVADPARLVVLNPGERRVGNQALIAAGTGLGESLLIWDSARGTHVPTPSEGGHADFAPRDDEEMDLWRFARRRHEHVSYERLVSGVFGFPLILEWLWESGRAPVDAGLREALARGGEVGGAVAAAARSGVVCAARAMDLMFSMYGAEAGNLALKGYAVGGVFIGGGIAAKNSDWIQRGGFRESFVAKGRFRAMMERVPVTLVVDPEVSLKGAARALAVSNRESS